MKISVCMIVKNEEEVIERCLSCVVKFADEIIVVDTGSTDCTKDLALKFTDKVLDFKWIGDFSAARNFSFAQASLDYVMWLDADDVIFDEDIAKINELKKVANPADLYMFDYVLSHEEDGTPIFKYKRERLFSREKNYQWVDPVHEVIVPSGRVENVDIKIYHKKEKSPEKGRNLKIYRNLKAKKVKFSPRQQFYYARELMFNGLNGEAIGALNKFLKMPDSWVENKIQACIDLSSCYQNLGLNEKAKQSLLKSFLFASPRSEVTCRLGNIFLQEKRLDEAIYWFKQSFNNLEGMSSGGFVERDLHDFIPALQLCYSYSLKGDYENAYKYHLISQKLKPNDSAVQHNQNFFSNHFENFSK